MSRTCGGPLSFPCAAICFYQWFPWDVNSHLPSTLYFSSVSPFLRVTFPFARFFSSRNSVCERYYYDAAYPSPRGSDVRTANDTFWKKVFLVGERVRCVTARVSHVAPIMIILFYPYPVAPPVFIIYICASWCTRFRFLFRFFYNIAYTYGFFVWY